MSGTIKWLGQAGFIVKTDTGSFTVDPFMVEPPDDSERLYPPYMKEGEEHVDIALSSHEHWDHFSPETYEKYVTPDVIVGPKAVMTALEKSGLKIPGIELNRNQTLERCGFKITATMADHTPDSVGFLVEVEGKKLFCSGDSLFTTRLCVANCRLDPDVAFVCINGKLGNMTVFEAASYCKLLGVKTAVPTHYDTIRHNSENPNTFLRGLSRMAPEIKGIIMERGVEVPLDSLFA